MEAACGYEGRNGSEEHGGMTVKANGECERECDVLVAEDGHSIIDGGHPIFKWSPTRRSHHSLSTGLAKMHQMKVSYTVD